MLYSNNATLFAETVHYLRKMIDEVIDTPPLYGHPTRPYVRLNQLFVATKPDRSFSPYGTLGKKVICPPTTKTKIIQTLQELPHGEDNHVAFGLIFLTRWERGDYRIINPYNTHVLNFFVDRGNNVFFLDASQKESQHQIRIALVNGNYTDIHYIQSHSNNPAPKQDFDTLVTRSSLHAYQIKKAKAKEKAKTKASSSPRTPQIFEEKTLKWTYRTIIPKLSSMNEKREFEPSRNGKRRKFKAC